MESKNRPKSSYDIRKIGSNLKRWLHMKGITLAELSRESKVPRSTLDSWIAGTRSPTVPHLLKLNFSTDFLLYGRPKPVLPYFGEDVTHPSEQELYRSAFRELIDVLEASLKLETYNLALTLYKNEYGQDWDENRFREIHAETIFSVKMITSFYFCIYFGTYLPIIVSLWFLNILTKNNLLANSAIHDIVLRLSQELPLIYRTEEFLDKPFVEQVEIFDLGETFEEILKTETLRQILKEEEKTFGETRLLFIDAPAFFDLAVYRLDTALKVRKLPLVCLSHKIVFYGPSCPLCEQYNRFLATKDKSQEPSEESK